jgi:hypothetical protein
MARLDILDPAARQGFEAPPSFNYQQRKYFFEIPSWLRPQVRSLDTLVNQVGFVLQWGYFRASGRFFKISTFPPADILFVTRQCGGDPLTISLSTYRRNTAIRHRQLIRQALGYMEFASAGREPLPIRRHCCWSPVRYTRNGCFGPYVNFFVPIAWKCLRILPFVN